MDLFSIVLRTIIILIILFILVKLMGKKQVSQMNMFDYIVGITMGSVVADISLDIEKNLLGGILALLIYALSELMISILTNKSISLRRILNGVPTILMEQGKIIKDGLSKSKIDVNDLLSEARIAGYFSLDEIDYAIMETSGNISFLPKDSNKPITKKDMNIKTKKNGLVTNIVIDGNILENNLKCINKDKKWLLHEIEVKGYKLNDILLLTIDINDKVVIYDKNAKSKDYSNLE